MLLLSGKKWALTCTTQNPLFDLWHYGDDYNSHTGFALFGIAVNFEYVHWKPKK